MSLPCGKERPRQIAGRLVATAGRRSLMETITSVISSLNLEQAKQLKFMLDNHIKNLAHLKNVQDDFFGLNEKEISWIKRDDWARAVYLYYSRTGCFLHEAREVVDCYKKKYGV